MITTTLVILLVNQLIWATMTEHRQRKRIRELQHQLELTTSDYTNMHAHLQETNAELTALNEALLDSHHEQTQLTVNLRHNQSYANVLKALLGGLINRHPHIYTTDIHRLYSNFIRHELPVDFFTANNQHPLYDQSMPAQQHATRNKLEGS